MSSSVSWGRCKGGITCNRNLETDGVYEKLDAGVDGVGDRRKLSKVLDVSEKERDRNWPGWWTAGMGVDTPSAFASLANLWGGSGDLGRPHVGDTADAGER